MLDEHSQNHYSIYQQRSNLCCHAISQQQFHQGVGGDNLGTQKGTNLCIVDTIALVKKETAASTEFAISQLKELK